MAEMPISLLFTFVAAGAGAYVGSYLKKKGENLATREDIDGLVQQVSAVTKATKAIEAQISDDVWNRQRKWELKKESVFEAVKELAGAQEALTALMSTCAATHRVGAQSDVRRLSDSNLRLEAHSEHRVALVIFQRRAGILAAITCGAEGNRQIRPDRPG